jgi:diadenosine tetraphosphate (Ap4A) HIT family hydrolase
VAKRHVEEPFDLPDRTAARFWVEAMEVAKALFDSLHPKKINYEIHGNTMPHLHMHLFPRFDGDPFEGRPIDGSEVHVRRTAADLRRLTEALGP